MVEQLYRKQQVIGSSPIVGSETMSRLDRHKKNQLTSTIVVFSVILLVVVYFIFTIGFKMLLNASVFIAGLTNKNTAAPLNKTDDIIGRVDIDAIPTATNSARVTVSGSVVNLNKIEFYLNDEKVKSITLNSSDTFSEEIGDLEKGDNKIYVKALSADGRQKKQSGIFTVLYKPEKPRLEINSPSDKSKTSKQEITVRGSTDKETFVKIQDLPAVVDAKGNFEMDIRLKEGDNTITAVATDIAGNSETKSITITYQKD